MPSRLDYGEYLTHVSQVKDFILIHVVKGVDGDCVIFDIMGYYAFNQDTFIMDYHKIPFVDEKLAVFPINRFYFPTY